MDVGSDSSFHAPVPPSTSDGPEMKSRTQDEEEEEEPSDLLHHIHDLHESWMIAPGATDQDNFRHMRYCFGFTADDDIKDETQLAITYQAKMVQLADLERALHTRVAAAHREIAAIRALASLAYQGLRAVVAMRATTK